MTVLRGRAISPEKFALAADWLAVGVAASLPWSTSATGILIAIWLVTVLPTLDAAAIRREIASAAGGLPVLQWLLAAIGMLWADATWSERLNGLGGYNKFLVIPLLLAHFRRSEHGAWVLEAFLVAVVCLMLVSWALVLFPSIPWHVTWSGVPVKDYIFQSEIFLISAFWLLSLALTDCRAGRWGAPLMLVGLAALFIANIFFVAAGRTVFLVAPVLLLLLSWRQFGWKGLFGGCLAGCALGAALWFSSPYLQERIKTSLAELRSYESSNVALTSTALHLDFLAKSLSSVMTAPLIGHGIGSIPEEFRKASMGQTGPLAVPSANPHNQLFAVAIQLGLVGAALLVAMWAAHVMLFRGAHYAAWIGLIVVTENIVGSFFNSHLFDFSQGWLYVFGVGVAGGTVLREQDLDQTLTARRAA